jgi:hypothetical protein
VQSFVECKVGEADCTILDDVQTASAGESNTRVDATPRKACSKLLAWLVQGHGVPLPNPCPHEKESFAPCFSDSPPGVPFHCKVAAQNLIFGLESQSKCLCVMPVGFHEVTMSFSVLECEPSQF